MTIGEADADLAAHERVELGELEEALRGFSGGARATIADRRPIPYRSTFPLEELLVQWADGIEEWMVFKDLSVSGPTDPASRVRAPFLRDPLREIETYRDILADGRLSAPGYRGAVIAPDRDRYWLFLERVDGDLLWQIGEAAIWQRVAQWSARMHARFAGRPPRQPRSLLTHDADYHRRWLERASHTVRWPESWPPYARDFGRLARGHERAVDWLAAQPVTFLHGELYPSNVLVERGGAERPIRPLDWEMAGVGPGLLDLAALLSGAWTEAERAALAAAYESALPLHLRPSDVELRIGLDRCRLLLAVQWLGWSAQWTPPPEHAHDWLSTALELSDQVTSE